MFIILLHLLILIFYSELLRYTKKNLDLFVLKIHIKSVFVQFIHQHIHVESFPCCPCYSRRRRDRLGLWLPFHYLMYKQTNSIVFSNMLIKHEYTLNKLLNWSTRNGLITFFQSQMQWSSPIQVFWINISTFWNERFNNLIMTCWRMERNEIIWNCLNFFTTLMCKCENWMPKYWHLLTKNIADRFLTISSIYYVVQWESNLNKQFNWCLYRLSFKLILSLL